MANAKTDCESDLDSTKLDLNAQNSQGNTPIHQLIDKTHAKKTPEEVQKLEQCDIQNLKLLLKFHPDANIQNKEGYTSVHLAIKNQRSDALVQMFLDHGGECDYNSTDKEGCSALYHAVSPISYNLESKSSQYSNLNFKFRDASIIKQLVEKGAKVDISAKNGYTPLLLAVVMRKTDYVRVMLEKFLANLSVGGLEQTVNTYLFSGHLSHIAYPPKGCYGMTPLLVSVYDDNKEMTQLLVKAGANVNAVNGINNGADYKKTPLLISVYNCNLGITKILVSAGANLNAVKENGDNALHMITKYDVKTRIATKEEKEISKLLIDSGIDLNARNKSGETALHLAISNDKQEIVTYIIEKGLATL